VQAFDLPRDGSQVSIDFHVELTLGHELVLLGVDGGLEQCDYHNN